MSKISYAMAFEKNAIIKNMPLIFEGRKLPKGMSAKVVLVRVQYERLVKEFEDSCQEMLKGLKREGFDDDAQKFQRLSDIMSRKSSLDKPKQSAKSKEGDDSEKPDAPTPEDLKELEENESWMMEFEKEQKDLIEEYGKAREEKSKEIVSFEERKFTLEELDHIIDMIGTEGDMKVNDREVPKEMFIDAIGSMFTE